MTQTSRRIVLAAPGYGSQTSEAGRGIWRACRDMDGVTVNCSGGSLLANNFNQLWCYALNQSESGSGVDYFAMLHSDIGPEDFWLDSLIDELESKELDILGVAVPIKDMRGLTSLAIDGETTWQPSCRITTREVASLPPTFTSEHIDGKLLLNTGCWVCKFDLEWARKVHFTINDRIVYDRTNKKYRAECEPEDWYFSRLCHELGLQIGVTRKVSLVHTGQVEFSNQNIWGNSFDSVRGQTRSFLDNLYPSDVPGWLAPDEALTLAEMAEGKDVLEIGSFCGKSTVCMARVAKSVTCCDYWDGRGTAEPRSTYAEFRETIKRYGVAGKISELHPDDDVPQSQFDLVFIDGDHSRESVQTDIVKALQALRPGGLIAFHDYHRPHGIDQGVTEAVDEFIQCGASLLKQAMSVAVVRPPISVPTI